MIKTEKIIADYKALYKRMVEADIPKDHIFDAILQDMDIGGHFLYAKLLVEEKKNLPQEDSLAYLKAYETLEHFFMQEAKKYIDTLEKVNINNYSYTSVNGYALLESFGFDHPGSIMNQEYQTLSRIKSEEDFKILFFEMKKQEFIICSEENFLKVFSGIKTTDSIKIIWLKKKYSLSHFFEKLKQYGYIHVDEHYSALVAKGNFFISTDGKPFQNLRGGKFTHLQRIAKTSPEIDDISLIFKSLNG